MNEMLEEAIAPFERGDRKLASKAMGEFAKKIVAKGRPCCRVARSVAVL
jgi:hypothetical protein